MQISLTVARNTLSPELSRKLRAVSDKTSLHQAMGLAIVSLAKRAFNDSSLRPSPWADKTNGQPATLRKSGTLAKSIRVVSATNSGVLVASDRKYAAIHQLGGKTAAHIIRPKNGKALNIPGIGLRKKVNHPGSKIPARPYLPFDSTGKPTEKATIQIIKVVSAKLK